MPNRRILLVVALCLAAFHACDDPRIERPDLVLVTLDTTRADRVHDPDRAARIAPRLADFARGARSFSEARSVASLTLPAHASMMTGLFPPRHRVRGNAPMILPPSAETLAERAAAAGYRTAGFVAALALDEAYGIAQGFETWSQPNSNSDRFVSEISERSGAAVAAAVESWLEKAGDDGRPLFLWVHFFDPHAPYAPSKRFLERAGGHPYDGEIAAMDAAFGRVVDALDAHRGLEDAVVLVVGDHGESLGEHGERTHGLLAYDATLRVPFLLREPSGHGAGTTDPTPVGVADVYPTLLAAMGLEVPESLDGANLLRRNAPADRALYCETYEGWRQFGWSPLTGWVVDGKKYLHSSRPELYDLRADPAEGVNLAGTGVDATPYLERFEALNARPKLEPVPLPELDARAARELTALGYTKSGALDRDLPRPGGDFDGPSPAQGMEEARATETATELFVRGRLEQAATAYRELLEANPANRVAAERLTEIRLSQERWEDALALLRRRARRPPETIALHRDLARCLTELGREAEARPHVRRSLELLILHHERRGEDAEADRFRRILEDAPR